MFACTLIQYLIICLPVCGFKQHAFSDLPLNEAEAKFALATSTGDVIDVGTFGVAFMYSHTYVCVLYVHWCTLLCLFVTPFYYLPLF
jgi:hypothetical protein